MNKKNLILSAFVMINAILVASISMTLAWYGYGSKLSVDNLNITFVGEKNLQVSLTDSNFKDTIKDQDVGKIEPFTPVSSMYSSEWISLKSDKPVFKGAFSRPSIDRPHTFKKPGDATNGFFTTDVYLYSDYDLYATIDTTEPLILADEEANNKAVDKILMADPSLDEKEIINNLNNIKKSMRVSILDPDKDNYSYTIIDPYKDGETYLCGRLALFSGDYYDSYSKDNQNYEFVYGEYTQDDKIIYDEAVKKPSEIANKFASPSVFNAKTNTNTHPFDMEKSIANGFKPAIENSIAPSQVKDEILIPVTRYTPKRLIVSFYLEGWDLDNTDQARYGSFISNVKFKIARER